MKRAAERQNLRDSQVGLVVLLVVGVVLLVIRALEFDALNCRWDDNAYGSIVWTLLTYWSGSSLRSWNLLSGRGGLRRHRTPSGDRVRVGGEKKYPTCVRIFSDPLAVHLHSSKLIFSKWPRVSFVRAGPIFLSAGWAALPFSQSQNKLPNAYRANQGIAKQLSCRTQAIPPPDLPFWGNSNQLQQRCQPEELIFPHRSNGTKKA
jgi:hypothetical protein